MQRTVIVSCSSAVNWWMISDEGSIVRLSRNTDSWKRKSTATQSSCCSIFSNSNRFKGSINQRAVVTDLSSLSQPPLFKGEEQKLRKAEWYKLSFIHTMNAPPSSPTLKSKAMDLLPSYLSMTLLKDSRRCIERKATKSNHHRFFSPPARILWIFVQSADDQIRTLMDSSGCVRVKHPQERVRPPAWRTNKSPHSRDHWRLWRLILYDSVRRSLHRLILALVLKGGTTWKQSQQRIMLFNPLR